MGATAAAAARIAPLPNRLAVWSRQAVESFVAAQRILMELTAQQNALVIGLLREHLTIPDIHPMKTAAHIADQSVSTLTGMGKILLDLATGETNLVVDGVKEGLRLPPPAGAVAEVVRHRIDTIIEMHRRLLDAVAEQTHAVVESFDDDKGLNVVSGVRQMAKQAIEGFVETEKKFLDLVSEEVTAGANAAKEGRKFTADRSKSMTKLAHQAVDQFIEAQKQILELAIEQFETEEPTAAERAEAAKAAAAARQELRDSIAEVTQKGVRNLVQAQKSLMDLAMKPPKPAAATAARHAPAAERPAAARRPRHKKA